MGFKSGQNQLCAFICNSRNLRGSKCNYVAYYVGTVSTTVEIYRVQTFHQVFSVDGLSTTVEIYRVPNGQIFNHLSTPHREDFTSNICGENQEFILSCLYSLTYRKYVSLFNSNERINARLPISPFTTR